MAAASELKTRLQQAVKEAMRARDKTRLGVLRMATAAVKQREVDERTELDDPQVLEVLTRMVKQRRESIAQYRDAGRDDLAAVEEAELDVLAGFMPQPLSEADLQAMVDQVIADTGAAGMQDMGRVMGQLKPQVQGRADMGAVSKMVKARLAS
ncbi:GatB/YqeY domain-containing protein [Alkalilimnicola ehrlichii]|uniref:GatB/YqeY domain-containing protein n=1 Tax=Alkalilimnicola ehrlichii TaxID=351052 RepID=UPI003B9E00AF